MKLFWVAIKTILLFPIWLLSTALSLLHLLLIWGGMLLGVAFVVAAPVLLVLRGGDGWQEAVLCIVVGPMIFGFWWNRREDVTEAKRLAYRR